MRACIDIGGTKVSVSLNDAARPLELLATRHEPTAHSGPPEAVALQCIRMVDEACAELRVDPAVVQAVGVAAPGPFVMRGDCIELATPNICGGLPGSGRQLPNDWRTAPIEAPLRRRFTRVRVENDAVAALEAERLWGALQGVEHCAYVTWSTGVGCGLCVGGKVLRGKNGNAGHLGHAFVSDNDQVVCGCGNVGDLEALVGGNSLERRLGEPAAALFARAAQGDAKALAMVDELCRVMGRALYDITAILDLQRISLGGPVFLMNQALLLPRLSTELHSHLPSMTEGCELVPAGLGRRTGDFGALALVG
ncbi:ROK family protein [Ramlibacter rhizophilus]|uniref:ROK family protein n=1 Tax=Ramlibacter rhizophilus TaxID=1781167 RepID=A0A4Z0BNP6_9BURK|nr:ROK family protein [Ramlibacter rhizophilus]TFY99558.1 ROK family protein [Ramlibacter rhizophilus]